MTAKGKLVFKIKDVREPIEIAIPENVEHLKYEGDVSILSKILSSLRGNPWRED